MNDKIVLFKNIILLIVVQFVNYVAPLLIFPYLTRVLSLESFGVVAVTFSMCSLAMIVTDFGFGLSGAYWIANNKENNQDVSSYLGAVFSIKLILALLCICIIYIYGYFFNKYIISNIFLMSGVMLTIVFQSFQVIWFFQGIEKMQNITYSLVTSKIIYVITILLFVNNKDDIGEVLLCLALSSFVASVFIIIRIYKEGYSIKKPSLDTVYNALFSSINFFLSRAAVGIYTSASTFIVGAFSGLQQAGLYSSAEKLYQAGQSLTSPLSQALYPYLARSKDENVLYRILLLLLPAFIVGIGVCIYFSPEILHLFYGEKYISATPILRIFMITSIFTFLSINLGYPAFAIYSRLDLANLSVYIAAILHLVGLSFLFLVKAISAINIAYCVCIVEFVVLMLRFFMLSKLRSCSYGK